ncbi:hypothetical protein RSK20926_13759 [Roseobacter sp. SK209-2-6]|uniref:ABC transporter substrate-binding protein n=1 Tax=Roseobacter sp. SK209-2-6 TaxID=388739 RepID=UPI0000F3D63C|nr:substrate-binding domain-containing protein [Roseobacter sp. SK209-2-6]EBA15701.1 hypothetical protein RSK20926_13759 [Roseobacter sp. SK209-2-6]
MRFAILPTLLTALSLWAASLLAFEAEAQRRFGPLEAETVLKVLSTTDTALLAPLLEDFLATHPQTALDYYELGSADLMQAVITDASGFDIAISSAMDLQVKLANDGYTLRHRSNLTQAMPGWANWRDHVFGFSQEPATVILSPRAFEGLELPRRRQDLITLLRRHPERFSGRIGTYDAAASGLGYLFATQDARTSDGFWRMMEIFGSLDLRLYCCSGTMIEDVARGDLALAYNVLGSYAEARSDLSGQVLILEPQDYTNMMLRSAVILRDTAEPGLAGELVDHLLEAAWSPEGNPAYPFHRYPVRNGAESAPYRPIQMGPGLMVYLDRLKRQRFLREWHSAVEQD